MSARMSREELLTTAREAYRRHPDTRTYADDGGLDPMEYLLHVLSETYDPEEPVAAAWAALFRVAGGALVMLWTIAR